MCFEVSIRHKLLHDEIWIRFAELLNLRTRFSDFPQDFIGVETFEEQWMDCGLTKSYENVGILLSRYSLPTRFAFTNVPCLCKLSIVQVLLLWTEITVFNKARLRREILEYLILLSPEDEGRQHSFSAVDALLR
ncbi:hypothetical protein ES702_04881 [subsurface metagenome]